MKRISKKIMLFLVMAVLTISFSVINSASTTTLAATKSKKVKLNKTKATIYVGKTVKLKVKNTKKKVKWSSSKKKVATVSKKGVVTGKKAGKATITAKVGKNKYKCKVTVKKKKATPAKTQPTQPTQPSQPTQPVTEINRQKVIDYVVSNGEKADDDGYDFVEFDYIDNEDGSTYYIVYGISVDVNLTNISFVFLMMSYDTLDTLDNSIGSVVAFDTKSNVATAYCLFEDDLVSIGGRAILSMNQFNRNSTLNFYLETDCSGIENANVKIEEAFVQELFNLTTYANITSVDSILAKMGLTLSDIGINY